MANYCYNSIRVTGENEAVEHFHILLQACDSLNDLSVYHFLSAHGYTENELRDVDRRDYINDYDPEISRDTKTGNYYFDMATETAWAPNLTMLFVLAKQKYDGKIKLCYISEEQGSEIFQTNDLNGTTWADKYYMDYCLNNDKEMGAEYFSSKEELLDYVKKYFKVEATINDNLQTIANRIMRKYHVLNMPDYYCYIYEFEYDNGYYEREAENYAGNRV